MNIALTGTAILIGAGLLERLLLKRARDRLSCRILVNGSRGKSSIVRLILAGLRAGGIRAAGKTTGSAPRFIYPDGEERELHRSGPPSMNEQILTVRQASALNARVLVVESMALRPQLQRFEADRIVRPQITVISAIRPDHLEVMGPDTRAAARSMGRTLPKDGIAFTWEQDEIEILLASAAIRNCRLFTAPSRADVLGIEKLPYTEHPVNLDLALAVCRYLGVADRLAFNGMCSVRPDPGALRLISRSFSGAPVTLINAFAANDPVSIRVIWDRFEPERIAASRIALLVNIRRDRPHRTEQLIRLLRSELRADVVVLIGDQTALVRRQLVGNPWTAEQIICAGTGVNRILSHLGRIVKSDGLIFGLGNISGPALEILRFFSPPS